MKQHKYPAQNTLTEKFANSWHSVQFILFRNQIQIAYTPPTEIATPVPPPPPLPVIRVARVFVQSAIIVAKICEWYRFVCFMLGTHFVRLGSKYKVLWLEELWSA